MSRDAALQSSVSERITPSADSKFDPSFQVFFCDDIEELNEAYFRDFTVNHCSCIMVYFHKMQPGNRHLPVKSYVKGYSLCKRVLLDFSMLLHLSLHIFD